VGQYFKAVRIKTVLPKINGKAVRIKIVLPKINGKRVLFVTIKGVKARESKVHFKTLIYIDCLGIDLLNTDFKR